MGKSFSFRSNWYSRHRARRPSERAAHADHVRDVSGWCAGVVRSAVEAVLASVFDDSTKHREISGFDAAIADGHPWYEYEGGHHRRLQPELQALVASRIRLQRRPLRRR